MKTKITHLQWFILCLFSISMSAQITYDWQATAPDAFFTQGIVGDRWSDGVTFLSTAPGTNNVLRFNNNHFLVTNNNRGGTYDIHGLEFAAGNTSSRQITGNSFRLRNAGGIAPYIQNLSTASMRIDNGINGDVAAQVVEIRALNGNLDFRGGFNTQGSTVRLISNTGRDLYFNTTISGAGSITVLGGGTVRFNGNNSYSGFTRVENGELWGIRNGNVFNNTNPNFIGNASEPSLRAAFYNARSAGATISSTFTIEEGNAGTRVLGGRNTSGTATFSGIITHNTNSELYLDSFNSGVLMNMTNDITGIGSVVISGNGIVQYGTVAKTYTGFTRFDAGVFRLGAANMISDASNFIFNGGIFRTGRTTGFSETVGTLKLTNNSAIELGTGLHSLTFANSSAESWTTGKELLIRNWVGTVGSSGFGTVGRIFVGVGGLTPSQLAQVNFNGYTGAVITVAGELVPASRSVFYSQGSLAPNILSSWNTEIDGSGDTPLNFNLGGTFQIQSGHTMTTTATWTLNAAEGSQIEILSGGVLQSNHAVTIPSTGFFTVRNGGTYIHNNTSSFATTIYQGVEDFEASSNVEYRNTSTTAPVVSTYGNLSILTTASGNFNFNGALALVQGNLTFSGTGTRDIRFQGNSGVSASCDVLGNLTVQGGTIYLLDNAFNFTLSVDGNYVQTGGSFILHGNSTGNSFGNLQVDGDFTATAGTFSLTSNSTVNTGSGCVFLSGGNFTIGGTASIGSSHKTSSGFYFNTSSTANVSLRSTPTGVRGRFFYDAEEVTTFNETYTGATALNGIYGTVGTPLAGYEPWPSSINNLTINSISTVTFDVLDKVVNNALTLTNGTLIVSTSRTLTYAGANTGFTRASGQLNASGTNVTLVLNQSGVLTLPTGLFAASTRNLTLSGSGVKASENITLTGILNLNAPNPNDTDGLLDMVISYGNYATQNNVNQTSEYNNLNSHTLFMTSTATTIGQGDVTGKITRQFTHGDNTVYTYGNANMQLRFNGGTRPTKVTVIATRGTKGLHVDKSNSVSRLYQIMRNAEAANSLFTIRLPYEDAQLNGNSNENNLVIWDHHLPYAGITPHEHGQTNRNDTQNWVELTGHTISYLATEGSVEFTKYWMISNKDSVNFEWLGADAGPTGIPTDWTRPSNWTGGFVPTTDTDVVIPATTNSPALGSARTVRTIQINAGATVNAGANTLTVSGGPTTSGGVSSWNNQGTFNAGTGTVTFTNATATISGTTQFNNLTVNTGSNLTVQSDANISIGGVLTQAGMLNATTFENTISYNGTNNQTVILPTGGLTGYHNLIINKISGIATALGDTTVFGTLSLTAGSLNISSRILRLNGPYPITTAGSLTTNTFTDIEYNNTGSGTVTLPSLGANIRNLTFNSGLTFTLPANITLASGNLTVTQGILDLGAFTINRSANGGTLTLGNGGGLSIGSTNGFPTNYATHVINELSSVTFNGANQTIGNLNSSQSYGSLTVGGSGTKNMSALTAGIRGNFTVQNSVAVTLPTTIRFNGNNSQGISGLNYQNIEFSGSGNKSFTSNGSLASNRVMTFGAGGANIDFDGPSDNVEFTFLSDDTTTAQMGNATGYTFSGDAVIQRYHSARRAFRFVTSSVTTSGSIRDNWQEGTNNTLTGDSNNQNPNPGFGTHITGAGGTTNGFDQSGSNGASMFGYNNNTQAWSAITNTNVNTLEAGAPYRMLLRGDRTAGLLANGATPTITRLRTHGVPHVGNRTFSATVADASSAYIFVGNPYLAQVNMQTALADVASTGVNDEFMYVWDPFLGTSGAYSTVNVVTNTNTGGGANRMLQPGQAVFVTMENTSATVTLRETHKVTTATNEAIFRTANEVLTNEEGQIRLQLFEANAFAIGASPRDGMMIRFGEFDNEVDNRDAIKFGNPDEEFSSYSGETRLSFNSRMLPENTEYIQLHNLKYRHQNYVITAEVAAMEGHQVVLHDQFNNTFQQLADNANTSYNFTVDTANEASTDPNRFRIILEPIALSIPNTPIEESLSIRLYPNPSSGSFVVFHPSDLDASINVYTLQGQLVHSSNVNTGERTEIQLNQEVAEGIYLVQLQSGNKVVTDKVIIKK